MRRSILLAPLGALLLLVTAAPAFAASASLVVAAKWVDGPGAKFETLGRLPAGARVDVLWCGMPDHWCLVQRKGVKGWLRLADLDIRKGGAAASGGTGGTHGGGSANSGNPASPDPAAPPPKVPANQMEEAPLPGIVKNKAPVNNPPKYSQINNYNLIKP